MQNNRVVIKLGRRRAARFFPSVLGFNCLTLLRFPLRWVFIIYSQIITFLLNERNGLLVFNFPFFIVMLATLVIKSQIAWWSHQGFTSPPACERTGVTVWIFRKGCGGELLVASDKIFNQIQPTGNRIKARCERLSASGGCLSERNWCQNQISIWNELPVIGWRLWSNGNEICNWFQLCVPMESV